MRSDDPLNWSKLRYYPVRLRFLPGLVGLLGDPRANRAYQALLGLLDDISQQLRGLTVPMLLERIENPAVQQPKVARIRMLALCPSAG